MKSGFGLRVRGSLPGSPTSRKRQASNTFSPKPVRLIDFRNCFGMIASVSTLARSSGTTSPVWTVNFSMSLIIGAKRRPTYAWCRLPGIPDFRHNGIRRTTMELAKIGKKGQLTIPRAILRAAGIAEESRVVLETTADGAIVMRPVAVYPIENYSEDRLREFEETNTVPAAMERRAQAYLKKRKKR